MAITHFDRDRFEATLRASLSPTRPIRSPEYLKGREKKLEDIRRALVAEGRHIFVYGDRGVGKTSLAQTAAYEHQTSDNEPILLTCDPRSTFYQLARDLCRRLIQADPLVTKQTSSRKVSGGFRSFLLGEAISAVERGEIPELTTINETVALLSYAVTRHSKIPVTIIDEFERIKSDEERMLFADLIKQIGDQSIHLKMIFCGVGSSLSDLLDSYHSCYRYLEAIELERLSIDGRLDIIDESMRAFGLYLEDTSLPHSDD